MCGGCVPCGVEGGDLDVFFLVVTPSLLSFVGRLVEEAMMAEWTFTSGGRTSDGAFASLNVVSRC